MSLSDRYRERLQQMIINLGGTVPSRPSLTDEENYTLQLLDTLAGRLQLVNQFAGIRTITRTLRTAAECSDQFIFVADRNYSLERIDYLHGTANSTAVECYIALGSLPSVPLGGPVHPASFLCNGAANTIQTRLPDDFAGGKTIASGQLYAVRFTAAPTQLANVCVTLTLRPI